MNQSDINTQKLAPRAPEAAYEDQPPPKPSQTRDRALQENLQNERESDDIKSKLTKVFIFIIVLTILYLIFHKPDNPF